MNHNPIIMIVYLVLLFSVLGCFVSGKNDILYKGYRVYSIKFETQEQQNKFYLLKNDNIDYWRKPSLKHDVAGQAMVPPTDVDWFEERIEELKIKKDIFIGDVYEYLEAKKVETDDKADSIFDFDKYHRYDKLMGYIKALEEAFTNSKRVKLEYIEGGITDENRTLSYLKITSRNSTVQIAKPIVVIEAGIIPREWITIPAALNIVNKLVEENQTRFLDNFEWIVIPVLNPDGYEYTHTNLRLWKKSRSTRSPLAQVCPGVNINRNFDIDWGISDSSSSPCSHLYAGIQPFSEPETQFIRNLIREFDNRIRLYVSLQNNGGYVSYPWQFENAASGMFKQHHLLGLKMIASMGEDYKLDTGSLALGDRASGTSTDYLKDSGILFTFNVNVRQRGEASVIVPESEILPIADKVWAGIATAAENFIN